jgi:hypothetical protein
MVLLRRKANLKYLSIFILSLDEQKSSGKIKNNNLPNLHIVSKMVVFIFCFVATQNAGVARRLSCKKCFIQCRTRNKSEKVRGKKREKPTSNTKLLPLKFFRGFAVFGLFSSSTLWEICQWTCKIGHVLERLVRISLSGGWLLFSFLFLFLICKPSNKRKRSRFCWLFFFV